MKALQTRGYLTVDVETVQAEWVKAEVLEEGQLLGLLAYSAREVEGEIS